MPVDAQINELYAWHGHITKLNGKNTIILMNDRTMYSLVFRNRLPRNVDKFAELIKEAIPYTMEVGGFNRDADLPIHYVAIYQSINIFGREAGIRYYGEVTKTSAVKRRDIREIPKNSDEAYYRFEIKEWKELNIPLVAKEVRDFPFFTNMFLLQHCPDVPDLHISSEEEYRLYIEVRRLANDASVNETDAEPGFKYDDKTIIMENGDIVVLKDGTKIEQISIETFMRKPRESMRVIAK